MTPTRILPDLQCSLLCEDVRREANGNFILVGIIDVVVVPQLPVRAFKLLLFNRWTAGIGQFVEGVRLLAPDQTTVLSKTEVRFAMRDPKENATTVSVFSQIEFAQAGVYHIEVLVDDVMKLRFPVRVVVVPPQPPSGAGPAPANPAPGA